MIKFIKFFIDMYGNQKNGSVGPIYDEDGDYVDPKVSKMTDQDLMIPAEKARLLHSRAVEDVKLKANKKVFQLIHGAIKKGKTQLRLETYNVTPEVLTYLDSLGYVVRDIVPPGNNNGTALNVLLNDDDEVAGSVPYHYYVVSWSNSPSINVDTGVIMIGTTTV